MKLKEAEARLQEFADKNGATLTAVDTGTFYGEDTQEYNIRWDKNVVLCVLVRMPLVRYYPTRDAVYFVSLLDTHYPVEDGDFAKEFYDRLLAERDLMTADSLYDSRADNLRELLWDKLRSSGWAAAETDPEICTVWHRNHMSITESCRRVEFSCDLHSVDTDIRHLELLHYLVEQVIEANRADLTASEDV